MPLKDLLVCFDRTDAGYARLELAFNRSFLLCEHASR